MFSNKTLLELVKVIDKLTHPEINRIISIFNFTPTPVWEKKTTIKKGTEIFNELRYRSKSIEGPFTGDVQLDLLQYLIDDFFSKGSVKNNIFYSNNLGPTYPADKAFSILNPGLSNSLKRDGYTIDGDKVNKLLPNEIQEARTESELMLSLDEFKFVQSKGHLTQAIQNHSSGNWAAANAQFRPFIESLMIEISNYILPGNSAKTFAQAVKLLGDTANPPFFRIDLNEITNKKDSDSFVQGFWIRLHPEGAHPGLSNEDDCSFRYHISIVVANYFLRRLKERK